MDKKSNVKWGLIGLIAIAAILGCLNFLLRENYISFFPSTFLSKSAPSEQLKTAPADKSITILKPFTKFFSDLFKLTQPQPSKIPSKTVSGLKAIVKFSSEQDFKDYLQKTGTEKEISFGFGVREVKEKLTITPMTEQMAEAPTESGTERVSETTVQVIGIDEPDIVKTNGREIYFSPSRIWSWRELRPLERKIPLQWENKTNIIKAFPPTDLAIENKIDKSGNLLLSKNILIIFSGQEIYGYDISDPKSPTKKWELKLENNNFLITSRLYKNKIYLVTSQRINYPRPCPIYPLEKQGETKLEIKCIDIYHPVVPVPIDTTFIAMVLDPKEGKVEKTISFVGSSDNSVVYMSEKGVYITYFYYESLIKFFSGFLKENQNLFPAWFREKIDKLENYDISQEAKLTEFNLLLFRYYNSLNNDERMKVENEINNRMSGYYKNHKRELEKTGIIKIGLENFEMTANGETPGYPLNQFALDEYQDNLRIAVTIGERGIMGQFGFWGRRDQQESANDVYVLDKNLKIIGAIKDLGLTERIYSARFIEDKGYLVTFRQTDPFYVLDFSNPQKPELKGELKIPGYSSYLHPITKDKILGIGKEGQQVKISLFDVSSSQNPKEAVKYLLNEYWSDILETHHAFLLDSKHNIFFLPGSKGGYVFSHKDDKLELVKAVSDISAKRAIYINDYLYLIGDNKIVVLNELNWEKIKELEIK